MESIIKRAEKISNDIVLKCLQETTNISWYKQYFAIGSPGWQKKYSKRMSELKHERDMFVR
jgi:hypothetical protein